MIAVDRILCPVDFSECSHHALEHAVAMADYYDARVTALHVYADVPIVTTVPSLGIEGAQAVSLAQVDRVAVDAAAERFVARIDTHGRVDVIVHEALSTATDIVAAADELDASMIVIGSHGRSGLQRLFLGSVAGKVLRQSPCPVMVVPPRIDGPPAVPFARVLCPIDFSDSSLRALEYALLLAQEADARLILLHAIDLPSEFCEGPLGRDERVAGARARARVDLLARLQAFIPAAARGYCTIETRVVEGRAHREILEAAGREHCDLIVMGVQGRGAVDVTLFGSNTLAVVHGATCPVLTIRE